MAERNISQEVVGIIGAFDSPGAGPAPADLRRSQAQQCTMQRGLGPRAGPALTDIVQQLDIVGLVARR